MGALSSRNEYPFAYAAVFALQCGGRNNVMDLKQWFYRFLRKTIGLQVLMYWTVLYLYSGLPLPYMRRVHHVTWLGSPGHTWGSRPWKTNDTSHNVWWLKLSYDGR
ncbi:hypothetical protein Bca52824_061748 [Brassica carinata]|uniref:Uncharacterized protein n=1 Tax=Brassica carinata TaxID=52824 RepID=A0A8X7QCU7_BRACI|nr:hypothetical protein Bca52824_061748 [Brassica carinata]